MKIVFFVLILGMLLVPQFVWSESHDTDNKEADNEYMLLLRYALEETQAPTVEHGQDRVPEREQTEKVIISIIPDSPRLPSPDRP